MRVTLLSFAKINIGLTIGGLREDKFHELSTLYQTLDLFDLVRVEAGPGLGITIACNHPNVPCDERNTCFRMAEKVLRALKVRAKMRITIEKNLPVEGGLGAASSNAAATMLGMEKALKKALEPSDRLRLAEEVGSDVPLFLIGGAVLGAGRGEMVYPIQDLPSLHCVVANPGIGISTPSAFQDWDNKAGAKLTGPEGSARMKVLGHSLYEWLCASNFSSTGVPARRWDRAETLLLDLVRAGIENDFERVVFPKHPAIREVKRALENAGAKYASLSGSGSTTYGLFIDQQHASRAVKALIAKGVWAKASRFLPRTRYWKRMIKG